MAGATILHADLDAFFAAVEQRDDPRLRGRPVIVGAGVVLAASYEAKAYGVRTAMGGAQARRLCPEAVVVEPRMSAYSEASKAVYRVFEDTSPVVEGLSIDEAFLDVRGMRRIAGSPTAAEGPRARRSADHGRSGQNQVPGQGGQRRRQARRSPRRAPRS
jgi:DNA polymerase-4